jgi:aromatic ring-opening dioxygenase catalytic subunit (LigB family)
MQCEEFRRLMGAGEDSDLIAGYARLRRKIDAAQPDVVVIFDTHWFTTGYHLIDAGAAYRGTYISDEMPWYLHGVPYDYRGHPALAYAIEAAGRVRGVHTRAIAHPDLPRHYPTINVLKQIRIEHLPVVTVSSCQNCRPEHYVDSGRAIGAAIAESDLSVVLLASGALSHRFNDVDWTPRHPRIFHEGNVSRPENVASDKRALALFAEGRHDIVLDNWDSEYRRIPWEGFGAHYLQMIGALGGASCRAKGEPLSAYENARGTGNVHVWFDTN